MQAQPKVPKLAGADKRRKSGHAAKTRAVKEASPQDEHTCTPTHTYTHGKQSSTEKRWLDTATQVAVLSAAD